MAPGTVARAYRELEADGTVITRGRAGTFVADEPPHSEPLVNAVSACRHRRRVRVRARPARARSQRDAQRPRRRPRPRRRATRDLNAAVAATRCSARLRRAGTAPYPGGRSLCCSDLAGPPIVTSAPRTRTEPRPMLNRTRRQGQVPGFRRWNGGRVLRPQPPTSSVPRPIRPDPSANRRRHSAARR